MQMDVARIKRHNYGFMLVSVKWNAIMNPQRADQIIRSLQARFRVPIYLYSLHNGNVRCRGERHDIINWVIKLHPTQIPWETLTMN